MRTEHRAGGARSVAAAGFLEVFPIHMARGSNVLAAIAVLVVAPFAFVGLLAAGALVTHGAVGLVAGAIVAGLPGLLLYRAGREAIPRHAHLALRPGSLELRHPILLRRPLEIPVDEIARVSVSLPESPGCGIRGRPRSRGRAAGSRGSPRTRRSARSWTPRRASSSRWRVTSRPTSPTSRSCSGDPST